MDRYNFNKTTAHTLAEKGNRMSQVLKKIMIRRTHASELNGRSIGSNLPSVQRLIYEYEFTEDEKLHYEAANADTSSRLFKKDLEWNGTPLHTENFASSAAGSGSITFSTTRRKNWPRCERPTA
jgi:hypothetical protein